MADGGRGLELKETRPEDDSAPIPGLEATSDPSPVAALPGALAGRYAVLGNLPAGRQARVFRVRGRDTGAELVVKLYHHGTPDREAVLNRLRELRAPHVLRPVEVGREDGRLYEVQEYAAGGNLADLIPGGVGEDVVREVVRQLVDALAYLHERGIAHRDLKPGNVLLRRDTAQEVDVALADFGSSAVPATAGREGPETCAYAPPEAFAPGTTPAGGPQPGGIGASGTAGAADCWALGMLAAEMLTGRHPLLDALRLDSESSIGAYLANGDLEALVGGVSDSSWRELCRGLLRREPHERWTVAAVRTWLGNTLGPALQPPGDRDTAARGLPLRRVRVRDVFRAGGGAGARLAERGRGVPEPTQLRRASPLDPAPARRPGRCGAAAGLRPRDARRRASVPSRSSP